MGQPSPPDACAPRSATETTATCRSFRSTASTSSRMPRPRVGLYRARTLQCSKSRRSLHSAKLETPTAAVFHLGGCGRCDPGVRTRSARLRFFFRDALDEKIFDRLLPTRPVIGRTPRSGRVDGDGRTERHPTSRGQGRPPVSRAGPVAGRAGAVRPRRPRRRR